MQRIVRLHRTKYLKFTLIQVTSNIGQFFALMATHISYLLRLINGQLNFDILIRMGGLSVDGTTKTTTDLAPRFARWSVILFAVLGVLLSITVFGIGDIWNKIEAACFAIYLSTIAVVAARQLRASRKSVSATVDNSRSVT